MIYLMNVIVRAERSRNELHESDKEVEGTYPVKVDTLNELEAPDIALDLFHGEVAIKRLEDFVITVEGGS